MRSVADHIVSASGQRSASAIRFAPVLFEFRNDLPKRISGAVVRIRKILSARITPDRRADFLAWVTHKNDLFFEGHRHGKGHDAPSGLKPRGIADRQGRLARRGFPFFFGQKLQPQGPQLDRKSVV